MRKLFLLVSLSILMYSFSYSQNYEIIAKKGKLGVVNSSKEEILPVKYLAIYKCANSEKHLIVATKNWIFNLFNLETRELIQIRDYEDELKIEEDICHLTNSDIFRFYENGKIGVMQFPEKKLIQAKYRDIYLVNSDKNYCILQEKFESSIYNFETKKQSEWFEIIIDYNLETEGFVIDDDRSYMDPESFFIGIIDDEWFLMNLKGKKYIIIKGEKLLTLDYDYYNLLTKRYGKYGFMDNTGNILLPCIYEDADWFHEYTGSAIVKLNGKYGLIDHEGNVICPLIYDKIEIDKKYNTVVSIGNNSAIVDESGQVYDLYPVLKNGKFAYKNGKGKVIIDYKFDYADEFNGFLAPVNIGGTYIMEEELIKGGKWGYIAPTGDLIIDCIYDNAGYFDNFQAQVTKDGKTFYIDYYGKCIKDCP